MYERKFMKREDILNLPVSITSWIVLRDYVSCHADVAVYKKIIAEYRMECPLFELEKLLTNARVIFNEKEFQEIIEFLFNQHHLHKKISSNTILPLPIKCLYIIELLS